MRDPGRIVILSLGVAAITGCTNMDGTPNRTATGGVIGAGTGALIGNLFDDGTGAVVGGAIGSIAGAAIGASLDRQQRELEQSLGGTGATVVNTGNQLVVTLPEAITFDTGSSTVHPDYIDEIALVARSLRDNPNSTVQVIGHTDDVGATDYNQRLSERRAAAVAAILTSNGVDAWRVQTAGRGYHQPVASNDTPGGRAQNRRVEIVITPSQTSA
jgi:outer membrane protein OmpA-like peptidoglycan-associated protein